MKYDPKIHHRRSIRLQGYNYSRAGFYFVTVCVQNQKCLFGEIAQGNMRINQAGQMVQTIWDEIPPHYPGIEIDASIVMPNHFHGIIVIVGASPCGCPGQVQPQATGATPRARPDHVQPQTVRSPPRGRPNQNQPQNHGQPQGVAPTGLSLSGVVHRYKTMTTKRYADGVKQYGWPPFSGKLWQRNYYEHIIRNDAQLDSIREYIANNPARWEQDKLNPQLIGNGSKNISNP